MGWFEKLQEIKKQSGKTTEDISIQTGISKSTLDKLFAGRTKDPQLSTIRAVVHCLNHTLDDLAPLTEKTLGTYPESQYADIIELLDKLTPEQRGEVKGYAKRILEENIPKKISSAG